MANKIAQTSRQDTVDVTSVQYDAMATRWELSTDLLGGTLRMRSRGRRWLPQETKEETDKYEIRKSRTILYNMFKDARDRLTAKPFREPVTVKEADALPDDLKDLEADADLAGRSLAALARDLLEDAIDRGKTHLLVDFPATGGNQTAAEEREHELRPSMVQIKATDLIGWRTEERRNGEPELVMIRWRDDAVVADGEYRDKVVERIRVMTTEVVELWEKRKEGEDAEEKFVRVAEAPHTFGSIPLVTLYTNRTGFMTAEPPLEDLAWINLAHYQSLSDQRNILRFARLGLLFLKGFTKEEVEKGIVIGPNVTIKSTNENADAKYVEHEGKALESGEKDIDKLEKRAEVLGLQPMIQRANPTVIGQAIGEDKNISTLQAWVRALETALEEGYAHAATWVKVELPKDFAVDVYSDFGITLDDDLEVLLKSRLAGDISHETFLNEMKRRGVLADDVTVEDEIERTQEEDSVGLSDQDDDATPAGPPAPDDDEDEDEDEDEE
jgi:hypothetical protein